MNTRPSYAHNCRRPGGLHQSDIIPKSRSLSTRVEGRHKDERANRLPQWPRRRPWKRGEARNSEFKGTQSRHDDQKSLTCKSKLRPCANRTRVGNAATIPQVCAIIPRNRSLSARVERRHEDERPNQLPQWPGRLPSKRGAAINCKFKGTQSRHDDQKRVTCKSKPRPCTNRTRVANAATLPQVYVPCTRPMPNSQTKSREPISAVRVLKSS